MTQVLKHHGVVEVDYIVETSNPLNPEQAVITTSKNLSEAEKAEVTNSLGLKTAQFVVEEEAAPFTLVPQAEEVPYMTPRKAGKLEEKDIM